MTINWGRVLISVVVLAGFTLAIIWVAFQWYRGNSDSNATISQYLNNPQGNAQLETAAFTQCPNAPFMLPSGGFIGLLWRDSAAPYTALSRHTGLDIFGGQAQGTVPVVAVYDGWLTRLEDWQSTVIIRHDDPLQSGRTIWTYYTHMAARNGNTSYIQSEFPAGTFSQPITQGTIIGYQGAYSPQFPVATHVHFSIVTSNLDGSFRNEAVLENTLNPSPYFGMDVNADTNSNRPVRCLE